ncbi:MAG: hypothetical protein WC146_01065 [Patescibacteria group bacterium]
MKNLLTLNYWFNLLPEGLTPSAQKLFIGFIILLIITSLLIAIFKGKTGLYRGFFKRLYGFCLSNAIIGMILLFFNYEIVPFLSARFWLGIWAISMIIWLISILKGLKKIPIIKKEYAEKEELKKYIP